MRGVDVYDPDSVHMKLLDSADQLRGSVDPATHVAVHGVVHGAFTAWREEACFLVDPRQLHLEVLRAVAMVIKQNPDAFRHLFTASPDDRTDVRTEARNPANVTPQEFLSLLATRVPCEDLERVFTAAFPSDAADTGRVTYKDVRASVFLEAASPYYGYYATKCGIRGIELGGSFRDWKELVVRLQQLRDLVGSITVQSTETDDTTLDAIILKKAARQAERLRDVVNASRFTRGRPVENNKLVDTCFNVTGPCESGHRAYEADGWLLDFHASSVLGEIGDSTTYYGWEDADTGKMYLRAYSLSKGRWEPVGDSGQRMLCMGYETRHYEVLERAMFNRLTHREE